MSLEPPSRLSPSKLTKFTQCPLAFKFSAIDKLYEPETDAMLKGTFVHSVLERLMDLPASSRNWFIAQGISDHLCVEWRDGEWEHGDEASLDGLEDPNKFWNDVEKLIRNYFDLEDPTQVTPVGLELEMECEIDGVRIKGIIDRLDVEDGELIVTDYKTGKAPPERYESKRLSGVHIYSLLCEEIIGKRPVKVQLLHLREPVAIVAQSTDQSIRATRNTIKAVWNAVERACEREDFRPNPSKLCDWCNFRDRCPAWS